MKYFLVVLLVVLVSSCVWASNFSLSNSIRIPTGYTDGRFETEATWPWKSRFGLYPNIFDRIEAGLDIRQDHNGVSSRGELKYKIIDAYGAHCCLGVKDISPEDSKWTNVVYVTATRRIWSGTPLWITLGAGSGGFFRRGGEDYSGIFIGARSLWFWSQDYDFSFLVEYDGLDLNAGLEYARANWWAQIYATDVEFRGNVTFGVKGAWRPNFLNYQSGESGGKLALLDLTGAILVFGIPTLVNEGNLKDCFVNIWNNGDEWFHESNRTRHLFAGSGIFLASSALYAQIPLFYSGCTTEQAKINVVKRWGVGTAVLASVGKEIYDWRKYQTQPDALDIFMTGAGAWLTANWSADEWIETFLGGTGKLLKILFAKQEDKKEVD